MAQAADITALLVAWTDGDESARGALVEAAYAELRRVAQRHLRRERPGHSLTPSALVHEAYLKVIDQRRVRWQNRAHFFAIAARLMRRILVDYARAQNYAKRGGGLPQVSLDDALELAAERAPDLVSLNDALEALIRVDERKGRVIELRFFGGLSVEETAEVLKVSPDTVMRDWRLAKAWLLREMSGGENDAA
jgi:RNA polymerase sigma factor (TIGR02999 family)